MDHDDVGHGPGQGYRREIPIWIEWDGGIEARIDDEVAAVDENGVAVRRRLRRHSRSRIAACVGDVLDVELLTQAVREFLRDDARYDVGRPGRRERHDDLDRVRRIVACRLSARGLRRAKARKRKRRGKEQSAGARFHAFLPGFFSDVTIAPHFGQPANGHLRPRVLPRSGLAIASGLKCPDRRA